jgi:hypothetical protein
MRHGCDALPTERTLRLSLLDVAWLRRAAATAMAIVLAGLATSSAGCGGSVDAGTGQSDSAASSACANYLKVFFATNCGATPPPASEQARLESRYKTRCASFMALPGVALTPNKLESCAKSLQKSAACPPLFPDDATCHYGGGTLLEGAPCDVDEQCAGQSCFVPLGGYVGAGLPPSSNACLSCARSCADLSCGPNTTCVFTSVVSPPDFACAATAGAGQACDGTNTLCGDPSLMCIAGVCTPPGGIGATCRANAECAPGLACSSPPGQPQAQCANPAPAGALCVFDRDCASGLVCEQNVACLRPGAVGAPCSADNACITGLVCPGPSFPSQCAAPGGTGAGCQNDADCALGLGCDASKAQCAPVRWVAAGMPCGGATRCLVGACSSSSGACPRIVPDGEPCPNNDSATCDTFAQCSGGVCRLGFTAACSPNVNDAGQVVDGSLPRPGADGSTFACASAAQCPAGAICCATGPTTSACAPRSPGCLPFGTAPLPTFAPLQLCATAAECAMATRCGPLQPPYAGLGSDLLGLMACHG